MPGTAVLVQASAHGVAHPAMLTSTGISFLAPARKIAAGQVVACYIDDVVVGSGVVA